MTNYILDCWYVAAWEWEVDGDAMFARTLLDEPWLLFRKQDRTGYAMLADRCPHRMAPLSGGVRSGDSVACPYHGLTFAADGGCVRNPFSATIPPAARVRSLPTVARYGAVWFWPGDTALADPALIPDLAMLDGVEIERSVMRIAANYELLTDNLMDLSHAEFIHQDSFGLNGAILNGQHRTVEDEDGAIWSNWWMPGVTPPVWATMVPAGRKVDQWLEMRWHAPATMMLKVGLAMAGTDRGEMVLPEMSDPHVVTPETQTSSHYFYTSQPDEQSRALAFKVFDTEDRPMLEAVQRSMGDAEFWSLRPVVLHVDAAAIRVRRRLMQRRRQEAAGRRVEETGATPST